MRGITVSILLAAPAVAQKGQALKDGLPGELLFSGSSSTRFSGGAYQNGQAEELVGEFIAQELTAAFSQDMIHAAHELNGPTFAHAILTTIELVASLPHE